MTERGAQFAMMDGLLLKLVLCVDNLGILMKVDICNYCIPYKSKQLRFMI